VFSVHRRESTAVLATDLGGVLQLDGSDAVAQLQKYLGGGREFGGKDERQLERIGRRVWKKCKGCVARSDRPATARPGR
jgi:hypothetical protein